MANKLIKFCLLVFAGSLPLSVFAEAKKTVPFFDSELMQPVALVMLFIIVLLLSVIAALSRVLFYAVDNYKKLQISASKTLVALLIGTATLFSGNTFAQDTPAPAAEAVSASSGLIGGLSTTSFYLLFGIILLEVLIILIMVGMFRFLAG